MVAEPMAATAEAAAAVVAAAAATAAAAGVGPPWQRRPWCWGGGSCSGDGSSRGRAMAVAVTEAVAVAVTEATVAAVTAVAPGCGVSVAAMATRGQRAALRAPSAAATTSGTASVRRRGAAAAAAARGCGASAAGRATRDPPAALPARCAAASTSGTASAGRGASRREGGPCFFFVLSCYLSAEIGAFGAVVGAWAVHRSDPELSNTWMAVGQDVGGTLAGGMCGRDPVPECQPLGAVRCPPTIVFRDEACGCHELRCLLVVSVALTLLSSWPVPVADPCHFQRER